MKKLLVSSLTLAASAMSAPAAIALVAGWDFFNNATSPAATQTAASTGAALSTTSTWGRWNGGAGDAAGESTDGTFGNLSNAIATASTAALTGTNSGSNLSLSRDQKPGSLIITLTNNSGADATLDGFYFDSVGRFAQSAKIWTLTYSGAISGSSSTGTLTQTDMMAASAAQRDWSVDLTGLTDNNWEAGQDAVFTLNFTGGASPTGGGGGHETVVDNIGITADVVPEPSSLSLLGLGLAGLLLRRRK